MHCLNILFVPLIYFIVNVVGQRGGCTSNLVRREVRELSDSELRELHTAFNDLKANGVWDRFCRTHLDNVPFAHSTPYFLPWHREFIYRFEQELRRVNPRVSLPYWDWSLDSQAPERSIIFSSSYFGGSGGRCVDDGPYANWIGRYPNRHCLFRSFDGGDSIGAFTSPEQLRGTLGRADDFEEFWNRIEGNPHGNVHNNIGGDMGTMGSCNDPLFYLHHAMIDKLWYDWQNLDRANVNSFGGATPDGNRASLDDDLIPFNKVVGEVMDVQANYCYTYSGGVRPTARRPPPRPRTASRGRGRSARPRRNRRSEKECEEDTMLHAQADEDGDDEAITPGPYDREDLYHLRTPAPLPDKYIEMMGLNKTRIRSQDAELKAQTDEMNKSGYISDVAIGLNGLLYFVPGEIIKTVDLLATGDVIRDLPQNVVDLVTIHKPLINSGDLNVVRNLLA
ncbi:Di-copper centre-containing protein [Neoconidiobolus thromboides FSU 785]|nr:Di-copper centre-containing protein [Neoconidiobolus thromboides FSU 785]